MKRILIFLMVGALFGPLLGQTRSSEYDGTAGRIATFPPPPGLDSVDLTVEAWVYREDGGRCETVLATGFTDGLWFGFCPKLRLYRSGGAFADATVDVPAHRWTHVAASYDGTRVRFFVDGEAAGTAELTHQGPGPQAPLLVGGDPGGFRFRGKLDEVRVWSRALGPAEVRAGMFTERRKGEGLELAFPKGGFEEVVAGMQGSVPAGPAESVEGMLPAPKGAPRRGTRFDGSGACTVSYPADPILNATTAMTIEAWLWRENPDGLETIVSQDFRRSFWFGVLPGGALRFYRSAGRAIDSEGTIPACRWTHVAVTCEMRGKGEPLAIRFYIDGEFAGGGELPDTGPGEGGPLMIGGDPAGYPLRGALDEVRLWNHARSRNDLAADRYRELHNAPGLIAAIPTGSTPELVQGWKGQPANKPTPDYSAEGVLPGLALAAVVHRNDPPDPVTAGLPPRKLPAKHAPIYPIHGAAWELTVKFRDDLRARALQDGRLSVHAQAVPEALRKLVEENGLRFAGALAPAVQAGELAALARLVAEERQEQAPDLEGLLVVKAASRAPADVRALGTAFHRLEEVEFVEANEVVEFEEPPADYSPTTPNREAGQTWRDADPGIDVDYAWLHNARGQSLSVRDLEYDATWLHEELVNQRVRYVAPGGVRSIPNSWKDHGTAVLGILVGDDDGVGISGTAPEARPAFYSEACDNNRSQAFSRAIIDALPTRRRGEIILLEMQTGYTSPDTGTRMNNTPAETWRVMHTLTRIATSLGITVVAAAGNGNNNLDDANFATYRSWGDSGAIIVGNGQSNTAHRRNGGSFGNRVNVQAWGDFSVSTLGYRDPLGVGGPAGLQDLQEYTTTFSGTSSASAITASACTALQSFAKSHLGRLLGPAELRTLLVNTGVPAAGGPNIGPHVNLRRAIDSLMPVRPVNLRSRNYRFCAADRSMTPGDGWAVLSEPEEGRVRQLTRDSFTMDRRSTGGPGRLNMVTLHLDLAGAPAGTELLFHWQRGSRETVDPMPASFTGWSDADGVAISADGVSWHRIWEFDASLENPAINLSDAADAAGIPLTSDFRVRFQQFGTRSHEDQGGITIRNVKVISPRVWVRPRLTVDEGNSFEFVVMRNFTHAAGYLRYSVILETASAADIDRVVENGVLTFGSRMSTSVRFAAIDDSLREDHETLRLELHTDGWPGWFFPAHTTTRVTILDDDAFDGLEVGHHERIPIPAMPPDCIPGPADEPCWPWPFPGRGPIPPTPVPEFFEDFRIRIEGLTHPRPKDLVLWVQAPDGTMSLLMAGIGGSEPVKDLDLLFSSAAPPLQPGEPLQNGLLGPSIDPNLTLPVPRGEDLAGLLSGAGGQGDWRIFLYDLGGTPPSDAGIEGWALSFLIEKAPALRVHRAGKHVELSWDRDRSEGWVLAQSPDLEKPWAPITEPPSLRVADNRWVLEVVPDRRQNFYQLVREDAR